ncbi:MAG: TrkH family potassium uptake protein [Solobacterium sp.]|nr:TrkH family potassium uptake protein [Solobacterium sp.]
MKKESRNRRKAGRKKALVLLRRNASLAERILASNNPARLLLFAFLIVIVIGSFLLHLPFANLRSPAPYIDNLFEAVSAVCVTGLTTIVPAEQYNMIGKVILIILMEIGGLGPMTIIAVIMQRHRQYIAMSEKKFFASAAGKSDLSDVPRFIRRIVRYTLFFELFGFIVLASHLIPEYGPGDGLFNALFLSVSAFTNSGFDCLGADSLLRYAGDPVMNFTIMTLIIFGGLGFVVWFEISDRIRTRVIKKKGLLSIRKRLSIHAGTVLKMTLALIFSGAVLFWIFESTNTGTIGSMTVAEKIMAAMFQSVTLRTAGFSTVNIGACTRPVLIIMCMYMLIGGSPGGTAGGMKTTTAAVLYVSAVNTLRNRQEEAVIKHRSISYDLLKQAFVILFLYVFFLFGAVIILCISEPGIDFLALVFEAFSAIGTVGISTGITGDLSVIGQLVIMSMMFVGRLGPLSVYTAFHKEKKLTNRIRYPDVDILIG